VFFVPLLVWAYAGLSAVIAAEASIIHQEITQGKDLSTVDYGKAAMTGGAAGAIVVSGGALGVGVTAGAVTAGVGFDVGHQTLVEHKDLGDVDFERSFQVGGAAAGGGAILGAGLAAGGVYGAAATGTGIGFGVVGATEGTLNVAEGIREGDYGKAVFGAVEAGASVWGVAALGRNFASSSRAQPRLIAEDGNQPSQAPMFKDAAPQPIGETPLPVAQPTVPGKRAPPAQAELFDPAPELNARVAAAESGIGKVPGTKTVSATETGHRTLSGWTQRKGFGQATKQVMDAADDIGFVLKQNKFLDQGTSGRYQGSHAELQNLILRPGEVQAVSRPICAQCRQFVSEFAQNKSAEIFIKDPRGIWVFHKNGSVSLFPTKKQ
jgi:hypothetical protein